MGSDVKRASVGLNFFHVLFNFYFNYYNYYRVGFFGQKPEFCGCCVDQDKGYTERVMLIYDGLHYDALAVRLRRFL
jgi:hypothetical protein